MTKQTNVVKISSITLKINIFFKSVEVKLTNMSEQLNSNSVQNFRQIFTTNFSCIYTSKKTQIGGKE